MAFTLTPTNFYISQFVPQWHYVGDGGIGGNMNLNHSTVTETWDIPADVPTNLSEFARDILGYSQKAGGTLSRKLPAAHPYLPGMWATGISQVQGIAPTGQLGDGATWKIIRCSVQFETLPYPVLADGNFPDGEWNRFTTFEIEPSVEFIERRKASFQFDPLSTPNRNPVIPGGVALRLVKTRYNFIWHQVPDNGLFSNGGFNFGGRSIKIEAALGCVNGTTWHDYFPGTLLLEGWKATPRPFPFASNDAPVFYWDVTFSITFFDPQPVAPPNLAVRGHLCVPFVDGTTWTRPYRKGKPNTAPFWRYQLAEFASIWEMN